MTPRRLTSLALALVLAASACGGDDAEAATSTSTRPATTATTAAPSTTTTTTTSSSTTTTTVVPAPMSALNGLPLEAGAEVDRRVVAVKIDNHPDARPQSGLQDAEAVIEAVVEGGITRFIALFHGTDSDYLGPIRPGRPTDPGMLAPLGATFQISGAQGWIQSLIDQAGVPFITESADSTFRIPRGNRAYERTLYGSTDGVRQVADIRQFPDDPPPSSWFSFGEPSPATSPAAEVVLSWDPDWPAVVWRWDGQEYLRFNGADPHGWVDGAGNTGQVAADTLLVLRGDQYAACPPDTGGGSCVPATDTTGGGEALLFHGGGAVEGTWARESITDLFILTTADGVPMTLPSGRLWVSVFPDDRPTAWA